MTNRLPLIATLILMLAGGVFLLERSEAQARDTIRKHHLEDIEQSLYLAYKIHGTYPPYDKPIWCGILSGDKAKEDDVLNQIEEALRSQNEKYAIQAKPFPTDPLGYNYFYWKRSPEQFQLFARLETDPTGERDTSGCREVKPVKYDYGISSVWRDGL